MGSILFDRAHGHMRSGSNIQKILQTNNRYDEIIFMADGKIIEHGTFETLIAKHAAFYDFYQLKK